MTEDWKQGGFGIYLHWPFCEAKCPYCDFNSHVAKSIDQTGWRNAYLAEIDRYADELPDREVQSVFFGGGTPSLMEPDTVAAVIDRITKRWAVANDLEITLEANPGSVEAARFASYRTAGVNRVSVGVQALNDRDLKRLGRIHTVDEAMAALDVARRTFDRASFDLIYARQDQGIEDWAAELNAALTLGFSHLSLYQLTIEDGTAFGERYRRGGLRGLPTDDLSADLYDATVAMCEDAGLSRYEVSNFAAPGQESRHNLIYWRYGDYVGIGPGAHGRITGPSGIRWATETPLSPGTWLAAARSGIGQETRSELSGRDQGVEMLLMGLRLSEGVTGNRFEDLSGLALGVDTIQLLKDDGVISLENGKISVQKQYITLLNSVIERLLPD